VGGREPHPVIREIAVDRDERDGAVIPREALEPPDAAHFEDPDPLSLQEPEEVRHGSGAEVPDPADIGGRPFDVSGLSKLDNDITQMENDQTPLLSYLV